jgi:CRP/FNR family transcriptional regulator
MTDCAKCKNRASCFNELSINDLSKVTNNKVEINYKKGETIIKQNSFASHIYFIKSGLVKMYIESKNKNLTLEVAGSGSMYGVTSINYNKNYNFSLSALNDVHVCEIDVEVINNIMKNNIGFSYNVVNQLNATIDKLISKVNCLSQKQASAKVAEMLIDLTDKVYKKHSFVMDLSRKDLAEITNMATENVVRTLKDFEQEKIIKLVGKKISIINHDRLLELSK